MASRGSGSGSERARRGGVLAAVRTREYGGTPVHLKDASLAREPAAARLRPDLDAWVVLRHLGRMDRPCLRQQLGWHEPLQEEWLPSPVASECRPPDVRVVAFRHRRVDEVKEDVLWEPDVKLLQQVD